MKEREEESGEVAYTFCGKCGEMFERVALLSCAFCSKPFCQSCNHRVGGKSYCSRNCWEVMFFGDGDVDDEDASPDDEG